MKTLKSLILSGTAAAAFALAVAAPTSANAWWGPRFRVGVVVPPVVIGRPGVVGAPVVAYPVGYRWIPAHYTYWGAYVPGHWGY